MTTTILGPSVMMTLGTFQFSISTAAYQELTRTTEWLWPSQNRFGNTPVLQFTGMGGDTITLPGTIYPEYRGGFGQVQKMRDLGNKGQPLTLIDGKGAVKGRWVIERLEEKGSTFAGQGKPRRIDFTLALRKFDEDTIGTSLSPATGATAGAAAAAATGGASLADTLKNAASSLTSVAGNISGAISAVASKAGELGSLATQALAPLGGALNQANQLLNTVNDARRLVGLGGINISGLSVVNRLASTAASVTANTGQLGGVLGNVSKIVSSTPSISLEAAGTVLKAVTAVNKLTVESTGIQSVMSAAVKTFSI